MKKSLDKTKSWTIKNCVYANIDIPQIWQNKLTYKEEMMKIIYDDSNFFSYLTHPQKQKSDDKEKKPTDSTSLRIVEPKEVFDKTQTENFKNKNSFQELEKSINLDKSKSRLLSRLDEKVLEDTKEREESPKVTRGNAKKKHFKSKNLTEKEKRDILDNFRESFKLTKKTPDAENQNFISSNTNYNSNLPNICESAKLTNTFSGECLTSSQKSKMFKSSIYSLLLSANGKKKQLVTSHKQTSRNRK